MHKYLIFACFLIGLTSKAQVKNLSLHAGAYRPVIPSVDNSGETSYLIPSASSYFSTTLVARLEESFSDKRGFIIGGQFDYPISTKFHFSSGLSMSYVQFHRHIAITGMLTSQPVSTTPPPQAPSIVGVPFGQFYASWHGDPDRNIIMNPGDIPFGKSKNIGKTRTVSMQVPVLVGTSFLRENLQVRTGAVFSYLLHASAIKQQYANGTFSEYKDTHKEDFNEFQAGVTLQTTYMFAKRLGIDAGAQKFFTPIYASNGRAAGKAKYNFLSLGLCYNFL